MNASSRQVCGGLLAAAVLLLGCAEDKPEDFIRSAQAYLVKRDHAAAIIQLKTALQRQPESAQARFLLGQSLLEGGDPVSAEVELRKAIDLKYPDAEVLPVLGRALIASGGYRKLTTQYATTNFGAGAATADLKTSLAIAHARLGNRKELDAALGAALAAVPDYGPARLVQARRLADDREFDRALRLLDEIVARTPDAHEAWQFKGALLFAAKSDNPGAKAAFDKALGLRKDFVPAHTGVILLSLAAQDLPAAKAQLKALKGVAPNNIQTRYLDGEIAFLDRDYKTAREVAKQILRVAPDSAKALQLAGAVEFQDGSLVQAESFLLKALQVSPDAALTRRLLARTYLRSGNVAKVLETLSPILESPDVDAESLTVAAQAYLKSGNMVRAETYFERASKLKPQDPTIRTAVALIQLSKGNADDGVLQLRQIAASDSGSAADMALISAYYRQGMYDAALLAIDDLAKKEPGKPLAADLRGRVLLARKDFSAARASFEAAIAIDPAYFPAAVKLADLDLVERKFDSARHRFDAVLKADPKNIQARLALAELHELSGGSAAEVDRQLAEAVRLNPNVVASRLLVIDHQLKQKNIKAALTAAQEAVAARPDSAELIDALGRAQAAAGELNQALSSFNKLAEIAPNSPQPQMRLAETYLSQKKPDAARQSLKRALSLSPGFLAAQRGLLMLELSTGRIPEALAFARSVQKTPGQEALGWVFVGDVEAWQKHWDSAAVAYREGLRRTAQSDLAMKLHTALVSSTRPADADKFAAQWIGEHPRDWSFVHFLADRALASRDYPLAREHYLTVTRLQPGNAVAYNNLAWLAHQTGQPGALEFAEKANTLNPNQPGFMDTLATVLAAAGQLPKAIEVAKKVVQLQPENPAFRLNLARLHVQAGDKSHARAQLDELAKLGGKFESQDEVSKLQKAL